MKKLNVILMSKFKNEVKIKVNDHLNFYHPIDLFEMYEVGSCLVLTIKNDKLFKVERRIICYDEKWEIKRKKIKDILSEV